MYSTILLLSVLVIILGAKWTTLQARLKHLTEENDHLTKTVEALRTAEKKYNNGLDTTEISPQPKKIAAPENTITEQAPPQEADKNIPPTAIKKPQHYYLVKELMVSKLSDAVVSTKVYEFTNQDLYKCKAEARLCYDEKRCKQPNTADDTLLKYELYIVNDVFGNSKVTNTANTQPAEEPKQYLLIDAKGNEQAAGRNFESFALSAFANSRIRNYGHVPSSITSANSFLHGNYKD